MNQIWIYDRFGRPVAYVLLSGEIYAIDGRALAYLIGFYVYTYTGRCIGFFVNGWFLDRTGAYALYTQNAIGGMIKPLCQIPPIPRIRQLAPIKSIRQAYPTMPIPHFSWSSRSQGLDYFGV